MMSERLWGRAGAGRELARRFWLNLAVVTLVVSAASTSVGQEPRSAQWDTNLHLELGADAALGGCVKAELVAPNGVGVRAGVGYDFHSNTVVYPVQLVALVGDGRACLELAAGVTVATEGDEDKWHWDGTTVVPSGFAGYRRSFSDGYIARVGVGYVGWTNNKLPWLGVSIGH